MSHGAFDSKDLGMEIGRREKLGNAEGSDGLCKTVLYTRGKSREHGFALLRNAWTREAGGSGTSLLGLSNAAKSEKPQSSAASKGPRRTMRGWRNTVEMVLFEISNSMKPYPSIFHAYVSQLRPAIVFFEPSDLATDLDEVSNCIPPTSQTRSYAAAPESPSRNPGVSGLDPGPCLRPLYKLQLANSDPSGRISRGTASILKTP